MKTKLYSKCANYNFENLFRKKNYAFFTEGNYNLNIIGVRSSNEKNIVTNVYDDLIIVDYNANNTHKRQIYSCTTEPGLSYMLKPTNSKGTAILVPGQYRGVYSIGLHNGKYEALCQRLGPVKVYRDNNRNKTYDFIPETIEQGNFGINIHRADVYKTATLVNGYSAGCQVICNPKDFISFMRLCNISKDIYGNKFTYTLVTESELI